MDDGEPVAVRVGTFAELGADASAVRSRVFVAEQRVPVEIESDGRDDACVHVVVRLGDEPVATGRIAPDGKVGRVAVLSDHRREGLGRIVMAALEDEARRRGRMRVWFHAQESAVGFYERLGYRRYGERFFEADIPHFAMEKSLQA